jgi:hypothetical protein
MPAQIALGGIDTLTDRACAGRLVQIPSIFQDLPAEPADPHFCPDEPSTDVGAEYERAGNVGGSFPPGVTLTRSRSLRRGA